MRRERCSVFCLLSSTSAASIGVSAEEGPLELQNEHTACDAVTKLSLRKVSVHHTTSFCGKRMRPCDKCSARNAQERRAPPVAVAGGVALCVTLE